MNHLVVEERSNVLGLVTEEGSQHVFGVHLRDGEADFAIVGEDDAQELVTSNPVDFLRCRESDAPSLADQLDREAGRSGPVVRVEPTAVRDLREVGGRFLRRVDRGAPRRRRSLRATRPRQRAFVPSRPQRPHLPPSFASRSSRALWLCLGGGEGGIRTLGRALKARHSLSRRAPSASRSPLLIKAHPAPYLKAPTEQLARRRRTPANESQGAGHDASNESAQFRAVQRREIAANAQNPSKHRARRAACALLLRARGLRLALRVEGSAKAMRSIPFPGKAPRAGTAPRSAAGSNTAERRRNVVSLAGARARLRTRKPGTERANALPTDSAPLDLEGLDLDRLTPGARQLYWFNLNNYARHLFASASDIASGKPDMGLHRSRRTPARCRA